jgi:hypothetical protein
VAKPQPKTAKTLITGGDPEQLYPVPAPEEFEKAATEYLDAEDLAAIGEALIKKQGGFGYLKELKIVYLWKEKGGESKGKAVLSRCQRPKGLLAKFCAADFIVWLAADHHRAFRSTRFQIEATVFHELCHTDYDEDKDKPRLAGHDYEGFCREVELYGAWRPDLEKASKAFEQLSLL